jgi:cold shock CspA family protein
MRGHIKTLQPTFGFIRSETGADFFFHESDVDGALSFTELVVGDLVTFTEVEPTPARGRRAQDIRFAGVRS